MREKSSVDYVVGGKASEKKFAKVIAEQAFEKQKPVPGEREKTEKETQIIRLANFETDRLRARYSLPSAWVPPENIHVIKREAWSRKDASGVTLSSAQAIFMEETEGLLPFAHIVTHELIHMKSHNIWEIVPAESKKKMMEVKMNAHKQEPASTFGVRDNRSGLHLKTRPEGVSHFGALNEAVVERLAKEVSVGWRTNAIFGKEWEETQVLIAKKGKSHAGMEDPDLHYLRVRDGKLVGHKLTYQVERQVLQMLLEKIVKKNPKEFQIPGQVFQLFTEATFTGKIIALGRTIDHAFGKGTFRKIGSFDYDADGLMKYIETL